MAQIDDLPGLQAFERTVALGSLTAAAAELGLSLAVVSKRLAAFEQNLGVRLINRNTRRLAVTEEGRLLYTHAVHVMTELARAQDALALQRQEISGLLKITAPHSFGRRRLVPLLAQFSALHPQLRIQLDLSDEVLDLIAGSFDLAIRFGVLRDSNLVARELMQNRRILCASPDYLRRHGQLHRLADLARHRCIVTGAGPVTEWRFSKQRRARPLRIAGHFVCNDGEAAHAMALEGLGIVLKSAWDVADDLASGRLVQVLPKHAVSAAPLNAVYLRGHNRVPRVRAFIDFLRDRLAASPLNPA
jgi:DNA-binding transcriptional LysR family regulator